MKKLTVFLMFMGFSVLIGCDSMVKNTQDILVESIKIPYEWEIVLEKNDMVKEDKILEIYEESQKEGEESFKDSLIIAKQYDLWKGTLTFARDSLKLLEDKGLTLKDKQEWKTVFTNNERQRTLVVLSYKIDGGLVSKIPTLYMTQAFLESDNEVYVISHSTEEKSEQKNMVSTFKKISYFE